MSRLSSFPRACGWSACRWLVVLTAVGLGACAREEPYELGQAIAMGPWTFEVERADDQREARASLTLKTVTVTFQLHNYTERHEQPFDAFMMGSQPGSMMMFPNYRLVASSGATFDALLIPASGGSLRSERWRAKFELADPQGGGDAMTDATEIAARYVDLPLSDFRLVIDNPDPLSGQPRRVAVQLR